jgi:hypothetical protein
MKLKNITNIEFNIAQRGWLCRLDFKVETRQQFTPECHFVTAGGRENSFGLFGIVSAFWFAYQQAIAWTAELQSLPGDFQISD